MPSKPEELNEASARLASDYQPPENPGIWQRKAVTYSTEPAVRGRSPGRERGEVRWAQGVKPDININSRLSLTVPDWQAKGRIAPQILPDNPRWPPEPGAAWNFMKHTGLLFTGACWN